MLHPSGCAFLLLELLLPQLAYDSFLVVFFPFDSFSFLVFCSCSFCCPPFKCWYHSGFHSQSCSRSAHLFLQLRYILKTQPLSQLTVESQSHENSLLDTLCSPQAPQIQYTKKGTHYLYHKVLLH